MTRTAASPSWRLDAVAPSAAATRALAGALAGCCRAGDVVLLAGGLGAGKTTFAQGFARALGVAGPVTSPTFTLVREYPCAVPPDRASGSVPTHLVHADVYRVGTLAEIEDLALHESAEDGAVVLVEWGDVAAPALGSSSLTVTFERVPGPDAAGPDVAAPDAAGPEDDEPRRVVVEGRGAGWAERRQAVASALAAFAPAAGAETPQAATAPETPAAGAEAPETPGRVRR